MARVLVSISPEYPSAAITELRRACGPGVTVDRLGPDLAIAEGADLVIGDLADRIRGTELAFSRHLASEIGVLRGDHVSGVDAAAGGVDALLLAAQLAAVDGFALQAWESGSSRLPLTPGGLAQRLTGLLGRRGCQVAPQGYDQVCSVIVCGEVVHVGWNAAVDGVSDWPGGRMRLARRSGRVSRAEFKLEELFTVLSLRPRSGGRALDLGASPGGWTHILRQHGLAVTAVDPGNLAPAVASDKGVRHVRTTAGRFLAGQRESFDCIVNDMRMEPDQSVRTMLSAANRIAEGGFMIMTLKLGVVKNPTPLVRRSLRSLGQSYDVVFARQLHHNRHEITVVGRPSRRR